MRISAMKRAAAVAAALMILAMSGCADTGKGKGSSSKADNSVVVTAADAGISADDIEVGYEENDAIDAVFSDSGIEVNGSGISAEGTVLTITAEGTYRLSGSCANGRIVIEADKKSKVKLVLNGLDLTCTDNAVITAKSADKVYLLLENDTENKLTDGKEYSLADGENTDAAVFAKCDLTINGDGALNVTSNYKHGIVSKDDLVVTGGNVTVNAVSSALSGKDSVKISAGTFDLTSGTDAVKSTNDEEEGKGIVSISGGTFTINAGGDGLSAAKEIQISGGDINITTGGGSANASMKSDGFPNGDWKQGFGGNGDFTPPDMGDFTPPDMGDFDKDDFTPPDKGDFDKSDFTPPDKGDFTPPDMGDFDKGDFTPPDKPDYDNSDKKNTDTSAEKPTDTEQTETTSAKALKSGGNIIIDGGNITIDSADDSLHCDGSANISGGSLSASSGDDGIHVGGDLVISGGTVDISKSYEGIEGMTVTISGGDVSVTASDDGINCAGGSDTGSSDRKGMDMFAAQEGVFMKISGGTLNVNAAGDGLDSNGDLIIEGGTIYVSGTENGANGSVDHNGEATITGGTIIASGAVGMEEMFDEDGTTQCAVLHDFTQSFSADTEFTVTDKDGNVVLSFTNPKTWQGVIFSSPDLKQGETYTVSAGGESEEITLESVITSNSKGGFGGMGRPGNMNGGKFKRGEDNKASEEDNKASET
ncbi:MAG: carbohydrate-binding domain-containing protein [Ruminococcus sp.]|uniref:carbohydrate-binding domain-containing protein n=1 Tax=Ruminococcus sp. TaxID=41978 RepID=UPI0025EA77F1|nr:carbohydrate-binding domain-containing protein [Ruminococcus sp.]MBO4867118.1 carbohydrate-binding domain-containing protein [Ruminococcus sp.]